MEKHIVQVVALHDTNHSVPEDIRPVSRSLTASTGVHFYKSAFFRPTGTHRRYRRSERPPRFFWQEGAVPAARYAAAAARHSPKMAAQKIPNEADGAKHKPLKVPEEWEPVIPKFAHIVISVIGLDCLGHPIREVTHRAEKTSVFLQKNMDAPVTGEDVVKIASSIHGLFKNVEKRIYRVYLNKADVLADPEEAANIARCLEEKGTTAVWGSIKNETA